MLLINGFVLLLTTIFSLKVRRQVGQQPQDGPLVCRGRIWLSGVSGGAEHPFSASDKSPEGGGPGAVLLQGGLQEASHEDNQSRTQCDR